MNSWICFIVLIFAHIVLSSEDTSLLVPCRVKDIECLSRSTEKFLEKTCKGISNYDIRAIDPLVIPGPLSHTVNEGLTLRFKNLNVTGLRNQKISDFQMDLNAKSVLLKTKADLNIVGEVTIDLGHSRTYSGIYHASASVLGTAMYNYELKNDSKNVEFFVVGPEKLTCEATEEPTVSLNHELDQALLQDPVAAAQRLDYLNNSASHRKAAICTITLVAYHDVVHNIRAAAKVLPKTAFFIDV